MKIDAAAVRTLAPKSADVTAAFDEGAQWHATPFIAVKIGLTIRAPAKKEAVCPRTPTVL